MVVSRGFSDGPTDSDTNEENLDPSPGREYPPVYVAGYLVLYGKDGDDELTVSRDDVRAALPTAAPLPINVDHRHDCTIGSVLALVDDDLGLFFVGKIDCPNLADVLFGAASDDIFGDAGKSMRTEEKMLYLVANYLPSASLSSRRLAPGERADDTYFAHVALCLLGRRVGTVVAYDSNVERAVKPFTRLSRSSKIEALRSAAEAERVLSGTRWEPDSRALGRALLGTAVNNMLLKDRWRVVSERRRQAGIEGHKYLQASLKTALIPDVIRPAPTLGDSPCRPHADNSTTDADASPTSEAGPLSQYQQPSNRGAAREGSDESAVGERVQISRRSSRNAIPPTFAGAESDTSEPLGRRGALSAAPQSSSPPVDPGMSVLRPAVPPTTRGPQSQIQSAAGSCARETAAGTSSSSEDFVWVPASRYDQLIMSQAKGPSDSSAGVGPTPDPCYPFSGGASGRNAAGFAGAPYDASGWHYLPPMGAAYPHMPPHSHGYQPPSSGLAIPPPPSLQSSYGSHFARAPLPYSGMASACVAPPYASPYQHHPAVAGVPYSTDPYARGPVGESGLEAKLDSILDVLTADRSGASQSARWSQGGSSKYGGGTPWPARSNSPPPRGRKRAHDWDGRGDGAYYPGEGPCTTQYSDYGRSAKGGRYGDDYDAPPQAAGPKAPDDPIVGLMGAVTSLQREVARLKNEPQAQQAAFGAQMAPGQMAAAWPYGAAGITQTPLPAGLTGQLAAAQYAQALGQPGAVGVVPQFAGQPTAYQIPPHHIQSILQTGGQTPASAGVTAPGATPTENQGDAPEPAQTDTAAAPATSESGGSAHSSGAVSQQPSTSGVKKMYTAGARKVQDGSRKTAGRSVANSDASVAQSGGTVDASAVHRIPAGCRSDPAADAFVEQMMSHR